MVVCVSDDGKKITKLMYIPFKPKRISKRKDKKTGTMKTKIIDPGQQGLQLKHWRE